MNNHIKNRKISGNIEVNGSGGQVTPDPTLNTIRMVLGDEKKPQRKPGIKRTVRSEPKQPDIGSQIFVRLRSEVVRLTKIVVQRIRRFLRRPDAPRYLALLMIAYFTVTRPALVFSLFFLTLLILTIVYLSIGPDKVGRWTEAWYARLKMQDPIKAEKLRRRALRVTEWATAVVDLLPKSWTTGLYLPDFNDYGAPHEKAQDDPFEKLSRQDKELPV